MTMQGAHTRYRTNVEDPHRCQFVGRSRVSGGIPRKIHAWRRSARGADYYHVNVSLSDRRTHAPLADAHVDIQVEQIGLSSESQSLELMGSGTASYGNYVRMQRNTPYVITVQVQSPGAAPTNARFEYRPD